MTTGVEAAAGVDRAAIAGDQLDVYGAETMSCRGVLVNHATEPVTTLNTSVVPCDDGLTPRLRRRQAQRPVRSMAVVMIDEHRERALQMTFTISNQSRHSDRAVRTNRSATPFACGARNGVRTISAPAL